MERRDQEKHLAFYRMRDELRKGRHCALCSLERKAMHQYFDGLLYEKVTDPGIRRSLVESAGFCSRHAHQLAGFGDGLGSAILSVDQLKLRLEKLRKGGTTPPRHRAPRGHAAGGSRVCPACRREEEIRSRHVETLVKGLADSEMALAFGSSAGLCFPHFTLVSEQAEEGEVRALVHKTQAERTSRLLGELKEFIDKHDYRRASEGFTGEGDSWLRAIEFISGMKNLF